MEKESQNWRKGDVRLRSRTIARQKSASDLLKRLRLTEDDLYQVHSPI